MENLDDLYAEAAVVISPLRAGSGLKIKLIEALSKGKAVVATTTTLQGVSDIMNGCAAISDMHLTSPRMSSDCWQTMACVRNLAPKDFR